MYYLQNFIAWQQYLLSTETLCQVVIPTLIGFLRGFGHTLPSHSSLFLKLFEKAINKSNNSEETLTYKNLVTESMKSVAGVNVLKQKGMNVFIYRCALINKLR
mgnify:CR=1 FL=1